MILIDYFINLSIFSLLVSTPLIILSFTFHKPIKYGHLLGGFYAGIVSVILMQFTLHYEGYAYDIRYVPLILSFVYLGPIPGLITGIFGLAARLYSAGNWGPVVAGWGMIILAFLVLEPFIRKYHSIKRTLIYFLTYSFIYLTLIPMLLSVINNNPLFHLEYLVFILAGLIIGVLLIESQHKMYRLNQELKESEFKYRLIAENTSDLIMVLDRNQKISYLSPSHEVVLGYFPQGLQCHPDDRMKLRETFQTMIRYKTPITIEYRWEHKNGKWMDMESRCMPVIGEQQIVEYIVMISRDISERKQAEQLLRRSEKLSVIGELAAGIAHEIRNPLTTLKGFIQLLKEENTKAYYMDLLFGEIERIELITNEFLTLAKPQAVQLKRTNIVNLVQNIVEILTPQALMNNIQFFMETTHSPMFVISEENQLKQALINIIKNAIEATPKGGHIYVRMTLENQKDVHISIEDEGCGIPEDVLPRLGEPFYTLKEKGTGLGLMISQKIVKEHHGNVSIQSKVNEGTTVHIYLPSS